MRRFVYDARAELSVAWLRLVGAGVVLLATPFLLTPTLGKLGCAFALLAAAIAAFWIVSFMRARRRASSPLRFRLELEDRGLVLEEGGSLTEVPWAEVSSVGVDEERLRVDVGRGRAEPLHIEPRYEGVTIYELAAAIESAWRNATPPVEVEERR